MTAFLFFFPKKNQSKANFCAKDILYLLENKRPPISYPTQTGVYGYEYNQSKSRGRELP